MWSVKVQGLAERLPKAASDVEGLPAWLVEAATPLDERIRIYLDDAANKYPWASEEAVDHWPYSSCSAEVLLEAIGKLLNEVLAYRYEIQELERSFVLALLELRNEEDRLASLESQAPLMMHADQQLANALTKATPAGASAMVRAARSVLEDFHPYFEGRSKLNEKSRSDLMALSSRSLRDRSAQLFQPGGAMNALDRSARLFGRLVPKLYEAWKRSQAINLEEVPNANEASMLDASLGRASFKPPKLSHPTLIDALVAWTDAARTLAERNMGTLTLVTREFFFTDLLFADFVLPDDVVGTPNRRLKPIPFADAMSLQDTALFVRPNGLPVGRRIRMIGLSYLAAFDASDASFDLYKSATLDVVLGGYHFGGVGLYGTRMSYIDDLSITSFYTGSPQVEIPNRVLRSFNTTMDGAAAFAKVQGLVVQVDYIMRRDGQDVPEPFHWGG